MNMLKSLVSITLTVALVCCNSANPVDHDQRFEAGPILFVSDKSGTWQLYSMNEDGSDVKQLTHDPNFPITDARWSPDGSKIAFTSPVGGVERYGPAIYVMNADGMGRYLLTKPTLQADDSAYGKVTYAGASYPLWSPDSKRIAFSRMMVPEALANEDIFIINSDGTNEERVTKTIKVSEEITDWSPDGSLLLADVIDWSIQNSKGVVALFSVDGKFQKQITEDTVTSSSGLWSPDQKSILVTSWSGIRHELYLSNADGSGKQLISTTNDIFNYPAAWAPTKDKFMLNSTNGQSSNKIIWQISIKNVETNTLVIATPFKEPTVSSYATSWRRR